MDAIGIIVEYNPFHNGHLYQINKVKELYPNSKIVVILNGYFLERGLISLETKKEKTRLALKYGVDLVIELPFVFGSNSADTFASASLYLLNELKVKKLVFGSESNDITLLKTIASKQLEPDFDKKLKTYLDEGLNYPTALNKAIGISLDSPNDLLGVSYIKAILQNNYDIEPITIKRTNDYHDNKLDSSIVSASNIREKFNNGENISKYIPEGNLVNINYDLFFQLLKYKILSSHDLSIYLTVDEGIDNKLKKVINEVNSIDELIEKIKTKRYTYNRIMRMFIHILIGYKKKDRDIITNPEYIRLLGFSEEGSIYLNSIKKELNLPLVTKYTHLDSIIKDYELKAASIYEQLTNEPVMNFELNNKPLKNSQN
jgi:predicted nucleotidyltransferase